MTFPLLKFSLRYQVKLFDSLSVIKATKLTRPPFAMHHEPLMKAKVYFKTPAVEDDSRASLGVDAGVRRTGLDWIQ